LSACEEAEDEKSNNIDREIENMLKQSKQRAGRANVPGTFSECAGVVVFEFFIFLSCLGSVLF
jgi:hypothetical protein